MLLFEVVKNFITPVEHNLDKQSSVVKPDSVIQDYTDPELSWRAGSFMDTMYDQFRTNIYSDPKFSELVIKQAVKIDQYRQLANESDVSNAIDEIIDELCFTYDQETPLKINVNIDNDKLKDAIGEAFNKVCKLVNLKTNARKIFRKAYIDGQLVFHLTYEKNKSKKGIKSIQHVDPKYFYYDHSVGMYKFLSDYLYHQNGATLYNVERFPQIFSIEEIVRTDFGLYYEGLNHSYLEYAIKTSNMLKTLEDLLVPLRFSRSVSRRVFNVDVGNLTTKHASEVVRHYQDQFKYKKYYNTGTGEISNQQHIISLVEDYWFPNRSGSKGTTVDLLDEVGGLGEMNDILYFAKKLYRAMKVPSSRIDYDPNYNGGEFSFNADSVSRSDIRFFMFISEIRNVFTDFFKEILRRQVVATGIMNDAEWLANEEAIEIKFTNTSVFMDKMKILLFDEKVNLYHNIREDSGKIFSVQTILKKYFGLSDNDIEEEFKLIEKEKKDKRFKEFYMSDQEGGF